jgi:dTDP-4-dehydrorhamnose reductase
MRIYLTGGSGFVGSNLRRVYAEEHGSEVLAPGHLDVDVTDADLVRRSVAATRPDAIVHCAIWNDLVGLSGDRRRAWAAYVTATRNLTDAANLVGAQMVLISTDWVFDGTQGPADESEPPAPINAYGRLKAFSEMVVLHGAERGTVARVSGVQGLHYARPQLPRAQDVGFGYLAISIAQALGRGERFELWDGPECNRLATPTLATDAAEMTWRALVLQTTGVLHCCGGEHCDRIEFARRTARAFGLDEDLITTVRPPRSAVPAEGVPVDTRLSATQSAARLGVELVDLDVTLGRLRAQLERSDRGLVA